VEGWGGQDSGLRVQGTCRSVEDLAEDEGLRVESSGFLAEEGNDLRWRGV